MYITALMYIIQQAKLWFALSPPQMFRNAHTYNSVRTDAAPMQADRYTAIWDEDWLALKEGWQISQTEVRLWKIH